jgi:hypothetical protein
LPATDDTYFATDSIWVSDSWPPNAGIPPPPFVTWFLTVSSSGLRSSRFGPTEPVAPASARVWQVAQLLVNTTLPAAADTSPPPLEAGVLVGVDVAGGAADDELPLEPPHAATASTIAASASAATVDRMFSRSVMMRVAYTRRSRPSGSWPAGTILR